MRAPISLDLHITNFNRPDTPADRLFGVVSDIAVGHEPQSELVQGIVDTDENGYVITEGKSTRTKVDGMFAAGDLVDHTYRQAVTAAGSGCQSALDAEWYLRDTPGIPTPDSLQDTGDLAEAQWAPAATAEPVARP